MKKYKKKFERCKILFSMSITKKIKGVDFHNQQKKICQITKGIFAKITPFLSPNIALQLLFENLTCFIKTGYQNVPV